MILEIKNNDQECENPYDILIIQADIQNIEKIECSFDKENIVLKFKNFIMQGRKIEKFYNMYERIDEKIIKIGRTEYVYLFDRTPKYIL